VSSLVWQRSKQFVQNTTHGNTVLNQDFKEFIQLLNEHDVRYLVVGGYAVAIHGFPRYTKDIDIWIGTETGNVNRLLQALDDFGFGSLGLEPKDFIQTDNVIQLGYPPARIDLLTTLLGVEFQECYGKKMVVDIEGVHTNVIDAENLKKNKITTSRPQDLADVENLT
jgi:hypothetical protein